MNILLLSAYDARSHQLWRQGLCEQFPEHNWINLSLPARHFAWRTRSNAMQWYLQESATLSEKYDLLLATSMLDLAGLRGLIPSLAATPAILYFHENQFAYPQGNSNHSTIELKIASVYSALAANKLVFNSNHNRATFLHGVESLMKKMPDNLSKPVLAELQPKCCVLPVPLSGEFARDNTLNSTQGETLQIVWNHRWEFDKGPERLLAFSKALISSPVSFKLHVVGQQFSRQPDSFNELKVLFQNENPEALGQWGFVQNQAEYLRLLQACDVVLSTAVHDFQGLAILEAIQAGCLPLVPNRLAYPEWIADQYRYRSARNSELSTEQCLQVEASSAVQCLQGLINTGAGVPDISPLGWQALRSDYQKLILQFGQQC